MTLRTSPRRLRYRTWLGENLPVEAGWDLVSCQCFFGGNGLIILSSYYHGLGWGRGRKCNLVPRVSHLNAWGERGETLVGSGHVSPRIWEMTIYPMKGGAA